MTALALKRPSARHRRVRRRRLRTPNRASCASEPRTISPGCAPHRACRERIPRTVRYHAPSGRRNPFLTRSSRAGAVAQLDKAAELAVGVERASAWLAPFIKSEVARWKPLLEAEL